MRNSWLYLVLAFAFVAPARETFADPPAEEQPTDREAVEIPLEEIWAYQRKGTKDVRYLEPDSYGRPIEGVSRKRSL